jgi:hypothetical protein
VALPKATYPFLEQPMISAQNLIGLIGGIVLIIYLFFALTHPHKF